jgi:hypothetical protein
MLPEILACPDGVRQLVHVFHQLGNPLPRLLDIFR